MFFTWIFSTVSLVSLLVAKLFFVVSPDTSSLLLALALITSAPCIPLVFSHIRRDMEPLHPLTTRASLSGYLVLITLYLIMAYFHVAVSTQIFVLTLLFSVYFHIDARVFFALALGGLIVTVWSLVFEMETLAESASIIVYLTLVIGVLIELIAPTLERIHITARPIREISPVFAREYRETLTSYALISCTALGLVTSILIIMRGYLWNYDFSMLIFFSAGCWLLLILHALASPTMPRLDTLYRDESRIYVSGHKMISYLSIYLSAFIMFLVDIAYFRALSLTVQSLIVLIGTAIMVLGVYLYPHISRVARRYINPSSL